MLASPLVAPRTVSFRRLCLETCLRTGDWASEAETSAGKEKKVQKVARDKETEPEESLEEILARICRSDPGRLQAPAAEQADSGQ